jgi:hypothetical protein
MMYSLVSYSIDMGNYVGVAMTPCGSYSIE